MPRIATITAELLTAELTRPWGDDVRVNHVAVVTVTDTDGGSGTGFSWTPSIGAHAVLALIEHDIRDFALGREADAAALWQPLWAHLHEAGSGGVTTIAMAGLDLALWDLAGKRSGVPLAHLLGAQRESVPVYGSGVNRHLGERDLLDQVRRWVDAGFEAIKIKVGGRALSDDLTRLEGVRDVLGAERRLMIDANQLWGLDEAQEAAAAMAPFDITWLEEPLRADDLPGYAALARSVSIPLAAGENIHTRYRFAEFFAAGAIAIAQPNVIRVGGVTPFLTIADAARENGVPVYPHLLPELSGQLALVLTGTTMVEDVEDSSLEALGLLTNRSPVRIDHDTLTLTGKNGLGLDFRPGATMSS